MFSTEKFIPLHLETILHGCNLFIDDYFPYEKNLFQNKAKLS